MALDSVYRYKVLSNMVEIISRILRTYFDIDVNQNKVNAGEILCKIVNMMLKAMNGVPLLMCALHETKLLT